MIVGGSTTSLLNLLNEIDYSKYKVDLLLYKNEGELLLDIPKGVHLLEPAFATETRNKELVSKLTNPLTLKCFIKGRVLAILKHNPMIKNQLMWPALAKMARRVDEEYDTAVSFLEGWPAYYVGRYVKARKKISWIHVDYAKARLIPDYDRKILRLFDSIVTVADSCLKNMKELFPELSNKICKIENIYSKQSIERKALEPINIKLDTSQINMVSVCRIDKFPKGLDRGIDALKQSGRRDVVWHIIGDGPDMSELKQKVKNYGLSNNVIFWGNKINPFPYVKIMDAFFLPSRYEGKPMAVTEAMLLKVPIIATRYSSIEEQIDNGINGIVLENSDNGVLQGIKNLSKDMLKVLKRNLQTTPVVVEKQISQIYDLLE